MLKQALVNPSTKSPVTEQNILTALSNTLVNAKDWDGHRALRMPKNKKQVLNKVI